MKAIDRLALELATLGPVGRMPLAPGTWGATAALLLSPWIFLPLPISGRLLVLSGVLLLGAWAATRAEVALGHADPSCVVIDEVLGQWTAFLPFAAPSVWTLFACFVMFRVLDIAKPWPIRLVERSLPKGLGVMADDLLAGALAAVLLFFAMRLF